MLFRTKVGFYTNQVFEKAVGQFEETGRPLVYTYFNDTTIKTSELNKDDTDSLFEFQEKLKTYGHYSKIYENIDGLKYLFAEQLKKIMPRILEYK